MSLPDILTGRRCFKLICGAGNEDVKEIEKLVAVYAKAGANYFDLSAREDVVLAAQRGLDRVIPKDEQKNYFLNISVGLAGDPHVRKALISPEKCIACGACVKPCLQNAIEVINNRYVVREAKCIGCGNCEEVCPVDAITYRTLNKDLDELLPPLVKLGLSSIELHAVTLDEDKAFDQWETIQKHFNGILSLCLDRSLLGNKMLIERIKRFIVGRREYETIIQADGAPMSGSEDKYNTTLQAIATADVVQKAKLPVWILLSGGTNSKTAEASKLFDVHAHGVAIGSYARKIIKEYIVRDDFLENDAAFEPALKIARKLVDTSLLYMGQMK